MLDPSEILDAITWLDRFYASPEGLARGEGLSINGKPDFEAIAAWIFDVYLNSRLDNLDVDASRHNVIHAIQQTDEWRTKHPDSGATTTPTPFTRSVPVDRAEFLRALYRLDIFYKSWNGLQREAGLSVDGRPDFEAIAAWIFGTYLNERLAHRSPEQAWDRVVSDIQNAPEWQSRTRTFVDASTLHGKHLMGYQGWFATPQDGQENDWGHWFREQPGASFANFDFWPDTREFFDSELAPTMMTMKNGEAARLYSSHNARTMRRHFEWMADAGIDGVSLGRFSVGVIDDHSRTRLDDIVKIMRTAAEATGRVFFIWYDATGHPPASFVADMKSDWIHLTRNVAVLESPRYLHHRGKPLVGLWGAGAADRPGTPSEWIEMISFLKNEATVLLGGVRDWRDNPMWGPVFAKADVVSPWAVGAFGDDAGADHYRKTVIEPDLALTTSRGQDYVPILFPGFSWHNLQQGAAPINSTPRRGGRFYWRQAFSAVDAGVTNLFTAMFDELDEGTAMLKIAETQAAVPEQGTFLALDADGERLPSDWYLRLAGAAARMLRGEAPKTMEIPIAP